MSSRVITTTRHSIAALVAVLALIAQVVVPHVHVRLTVPSDAHPAADVALATCDACPSALAAAEPATPDADAHRDSSCPLCRAQSDARASVLPPAVALPLPAPAAAGGPRDAVASVADAVRSLAAPRAPPALS